MEMNCKGLVSPQPILFVREVLQSLDADDDLVVIIDNDKAASDLMEFVRSEGFDAEKTSFKNEEAVRIVRNENMEPSFLPSQESDNAFGFVMTVSSSRFGQGNPRLGESLMQSFFYAMTRQDPLPEVMIFMNAGINLVCENSSMLQDLKVLEKEGVRILVDEASLNFYGFRDQLAIGEKADLMTITQILLKADRTLAI